MGKQTQECHYKVQTLPHRQCSCPNLAQSLRYVGLAPGMASFPLDGQCAFGARVGDDGCTWRADPLSFSISMGGLMEKGAFDPKKRQYTITQLRLSLHTRRSVHVLVAASR